MKNFILKMSMFPIRCVSCNKVIGKYYIEFKKRKKTETVKEILDSLKITKYCCRKSFI